MTARSAILAAIASIAWICSVTVNAKEKSAKELAHTREVVAAFGDCVATRSAPVARAVVLGNLQNEQITESARRLIDGTCLVKANDGMGAKLIFGGDQFRYAMAQALVRMDYPERKPFDFTSIPALEHFTPEPVKPELVDASNRKAKRAAERFAAEKRVSVLSQFGECVCRTEPNGVHAVLISPVNSRLELEAFRVLDEPLGGCLAEGQIEFGLDVLRGLLALNFYRLAGAPPGAPIATLKVTS